MSLNTDVKFLLESQVQFRILHWQTNGYARHMAFGEVYTALDALIDQYVETCMGIHGRFELGDDEKTITLQNLKDININGMVTTLRNSMQQMDIEEVNTDLLNIRDEMLSEINKLGYLLTLK